MMTAGAAPSLGGMKPDPNKPILQERDELTIFDHKFQVKLAEYRILNEQPPSDLL